ncbi:hypothetical protein RchiOBHm_Chr6g0261811 [Rosa chinensis]|uniref:Uncharacterized protein n=1 Tax=Rosa chinensis TaxID=74649 RepID=A0A2P6PNG9_ROSCH|nr:hypothetical protein RchiOBHm_Chr6g0261811 [Rosa chinensis]
MQNDRRVHMCGLHIKRCMMQPFVWVQPSEAVVSILGVYGSNCPQ